MTPKRLFLYLAKKAKYNRKYTLDDVASNLIKCLKVCVHTQLGGTAQKEDNKRTYLLRRLPFSGRQ